MKLNKKIAAAAGLLAGVMLLASMTAVQQQTPQQNQHKYTNLKILPKHITDKELGDIMNKWQRSLGVHCNFCHARNETTNQMDFASDAKPEKLTARKMFLMAAKINKKFFDAKKDSLGVTIENISCYTCHHGTSHPEVALPPPPPRGQGGQRGPGGQPGATGATGGTTTPPPGNKP